MHGAHAGLRDAASLAALRHFDSLRSLSTALAPLAQAPVPSALSVALARRFLGEDTRSVPETKGLRGIPAPSRERGRRPVQGKTPTRKREGL